MVERRKKVIVKNYGCSTNLADGEVLHGCLTNAGFDVVNESKRADVLIHNTCAVKSPTENRMIDELKKSAKLKKKLIVTGCLPLINLKRLKNEIQFDGVLGPAPSSKIVEAVQKVLGGERVQWLSGFL